MSTQLASADTIPLRSRIDRLRLRIIDAPMEVCIERARYLTESMSRNWALTA
jgi:hypothetical protein